MLDPLALLPFAIAAADGRIDGLPASQLVAAGVTLLQRSAPVVRALAGRRSAILVPPGPALLTALAASEGRGALFLPTDMESARLVDRLTAANVGALFTTAALVAPHESRLAEWRSHGHACVLLDTLPGAAQVVTADGLRLVDLGSHFGLPIEGMRDVEGRDEECLLFAGDHSDDASGRPLVLTHRELLARARALHVVHASGDAAIALPAAMHTPDDLLTHFVAPLLAGAHLVSARE